MDTVPPILFLKSAAQTRQSCLPRTVFSYDSDYLAELGGEAQRTDGARVARCRSGTPRRML